MSRPPTAFFETAYAKHEKASYRKRPNPSHRHGRSDRLLARTVLYLDIATPAISAIIRRAA